MSIYPGSAEIRGIQLPADHASVHIDELCYLFLRPSVNIVHPKYPPCQAVLNALYKLFDFITFFFQLVKPTRLSFPLSVVVICRRACHEIL